jgi:hypothetical protein
MVAVALGEDLQRVARVAAPLAAVIAAVAVDLDQAPGVLGDLGLLGDDDVHDDAALEHRK